MKVLYVATYAGTAGASHSLITMVKILRDMGTEPLVLIPGHGPIEELLKENNIPYKVIKLYNWVIEINKENLLKEQIKWKIKKIINTFQEIRIASIIRKEKIELVHINAVTAGWGFYAAKFNKIPVVWHIREFLEEDLGKQFQERKKVIKCLEKSDSIIAISDSVKNKYNKIVKNENLVRIYNGIDINHYNSIENTIFDKDVTILTLTGRIVEGKGHLEAIYALKQIIDEGIIQLKLRFVGSEGNEDYIKQVNNIIDTLGIRDSTDFVGYRKDMNNVWGETDIALVCSKAEAFGRVTVEAMLGGALVIGANTKGTAELIGTKNGLLYEQGNYQSLAEKIKYAVENKGEMTDIALRGQRYAKENFTADINAQNVHKVHSKLNF